MTTPAAVGAENGQPGLFDRLEKEKAEFLAEIRSIVQDELTRFAREQILNQQLLYTKLQAAKLLGISPASISRLVAQRLLKVRRFGGRRLYAREELIRLSKREIGSLCGPKTERIGVQR